MRDGSDRFGVSDIESSVLERCFVVLDWMLPDYTARGGVSEPGCFSLGVMIPSDGRVEQPIPESVYGLLHLFTIAWFINYIILKAAYFITFSSIIVPV